MSQHVLDRPILHALFGPQECFALGGDLARRYQPEISLLAAARDDSPESLAELGALAGEDCAIVTLQVGDFPTPPGTVIESSAEGVQMVAHDLVVPTAFDREVVALGTVDACEMLALAKLTEPGPFELRTHELGHFWGVREGGRLIAMAGERMRLPGYVEVSGVCTHPDYRGRGLAAGLIGKVVEGVRASGCTPFLHAYATNESAIRLYGKLGFVKRARVTMTHLRRA